MAKNEKTPPAEAASAEGEKPKGKKKLIIIIVVSVLALGLAGGAGWYFTRSAHHTAEKDREQDGANDGETANEKKDAPVFTQAKFIALEPFIINLKREEGDRYLQVAISLEIFDPALDEQIKVKMPKIRNNILLLLSERRFAELGTAEAKTRLAEEIAADANAVLGIHRPAKKMAAGAASGVAAASAPAAAPAPAAEQEVAGEQEGITDVLFTSFIIQ